MKKKYLKYVILLIVIACVAGGLFYNSKYSKINYDEMCEPTLSGNCTPGQCVGANDGPISCKEKFDPPNN